MKKIISFFTALALSASMSTAVFADGFAELMNRTETKSGEISIIYNGQLMEYTDAVPENINDRVMIPFRTVLETVGAQVEYDGASRLVTAVRGDTSIKFALDGDTIYINNNGGESELKMDVPIVVKNDRTLVPIRFMSSALGMQVGWDGDCSAVIIVDREAYAEDFEKNAPNLSKLMKTAAQTYNSSAEEISLKLDMAENMSNTAKSVSLDMKFDTVSSDSEAAVSGTISADNISSLGISVAPVKDAKIELILSDGRLYIKTELIEKLLSTQNAPITNAVKAMFPGDKWFYIDLAALIEEMPGDVMSGDMKSMYKELLSGKAQTWNGKSFSDVINLMTAFEGDADMMSAMQTDVMFGTYKALDKYITVSDNKIEMNITKDILSEILDNAGISGMVSPEEMSGVMDALTFDVYAMSEYGEKTANSKGDITIGVKAESLDIMLTLNISETLEQNDAAEVPETPAEAENLMELIKLISNLSSPNL